MKKNRHEKILEIIREKEIETQEELARALRDAGYDVTQATVSRDIRALHLTKVASSGGKQKYGIVGSKTDTMREKYIRVLRDGYISMDKAQNILVMKTVAGMAMAVAAALDALEIPEIIGCIAGDDTIMAAIRTTEDTDLVIQKIDNMIQ